MPAAPDFKVQVRASALPGIANRTDLLPSLNLITLLYQHAVVIHMTVNAIVALAIHLVLDDNPVTKATGRAGRNHLAVAGGKDWLTFGPARLGKVCSVMGLATAHTKATGNNRLWRGGVGPAVIINLPGLAGTVG